jgi:hypothetical protein
VGVSPDWDLARIGTGVPSIGCGCERIAPDSRRWHPKGGFTVAEFVRFTLDNGSQVVFESAESDLVALHPSHR